MAAELFELFGLIGFGFVMGIAYAFNKR